MILDLVPENDPILSESIPSYNFGFGAASQQASELAKLLIENMYHHCGIGLSANQIGIPSRAFAMLVDNTPIVCFNPRITDYSVETTYMREGCLSFPGLWFSVQRHHGVAVTFANEDGENMSGGFAQLAAKIFQHEYDHMLGKLYLEYASAYMIRNARKKQNLWKRKRKNNGHENF